MQNSEKTFLIVGNKCYESRRILKELKDKGKKARIIQADDLLMYITDTPFGDSLYFISSKQLELIKVNEIACIIPRIGTGLTLYSKMIKHIQNIGIPVTASYQGLLNAKDKMLSTLLLSERGIVTPKTMLYHKKINFDWIVKTLDNFPIVAKLLSGSRGIGVFILTDKLSASTSLEAFSAKGHSLILQSYIESSDKDTNKHDYRVIVINGKVECCIKRFSLNGDFRSNASISKQAENHVPSQAMIDLALNAAAAVGLSSGCGVDIVTRKTDGKMFVIECNGNFGFKNAEKFSKINVAAKIADFAILISDGNKTSDPTNGNITAIAQTQKMVYNAAIDRMGVAMNGINELDEKADEGIAFGDFDSDISDAEATSQRLRFAKLDTTQFAKQFQLENGYYPAKADFAMYQQDKEDAFKEYCRGVNFEKPISYSFLQNSHAR
jgi:ribosomal protein S6--L-glutamate ligase